MIMYPGSSVHSARSLQTIGFPGEPSTLQNMSFVYYKNDKPGRINLLWDNNKPDGYRWAAPNGDPL
ncbi:MAG: hypothetical protein KA792_00270 [Bacteroidales bacterium]|nr:hypothetical protein [Bacteroidales bacterium]